MNIRKFIYLVVYFLFLGIGMSNVDCVLEKIISHNGKILISDIYINYIIILCAIIIVNFLYPKAFGGNIKVNKVMHWLFPFIIMALLVIGDIIFALYLSN